MAALLSCSALSGCGPQSGIAPVSTTGAESALLHDAWRSYIASFIQFDGRVIDHGSGSQTTSEGQSYALLRAVWMDDRQTFDSVLHWTEQNLAVSGGLFGWRWGQASDGGWRLLSSDSAADADTDIALALVLAGRHWQDASYTSRASALLGSIWSGEVATIAGTPYMTAGEWAPRTRTPGIPVNPSYLAPYAYRLFAGVDTQHPWQQLVASSYDVLRRCSAAPLGGGGSAGLPPDWCSLDASTAEAGHDDGAGAAADEYGYDAFRVMWRVALDATWNGGDDARGYLESTHVLGDAWQRDHHLAARYGHDGTPRAGEDPATEGGDIGWFLVADQGSAGDLLRHLEGTAVHDGSGVHFGDGSGYYEQNWVWFGIALAAGALGQG